MKTTRWEITTGPTQEPITLDEARDHLRIDTTDELPVLDQLIVAAREYTESVLGRSILTQTITAYYQSWPRRLFLLQRAAPLQSVTSIKYLDTEGVQQTLSTDIYDVFTAPEPGEVRLGYRESWPTHRYETDAIEIAYVSGWTAPGLVPASLRQALLLLIGHWHENREDTTPLTIQQVPRAFDALVSSHRVSWL